MGVLPIIAGTAAARPPPPALPVLLAPADTVLLAALPATVPTAVVTTLAPTLVATLLQHTGSWALVLASVAAVNIVAALNYCQHSTVSVVEVAVVREMRRST